MAAPRQPPRPSHPRLQARRGDCTTAGAARRGGQEPSRPSAQARLPEPAPPRSKQGACAGGRSRTAVAVQRHPRPYVLRGPCGPGAPHGRAGTGRSGCAACSYHTCGRQHGAHPGRTSTVQVARVTDRRARAMGLSLSRDRRGSRGQPDPPTKVGPPVRSAVQTRGAAGGGHSARGWRHRRPSLLHVRPKA